MATSALIPCGGLRTDASLVGAPSGAMRQCDNAVIDAPGVASARPNFETLASKAGNYRPVAGHVYRRTPFYVSYDGSAWRLETASAVITGTVTPRDDVRTDTQFAESRGNLYLTTAGGPKKITAAGATAIEDAGMHECPQAYISSFSASTPAWLANNSYVAYRALIMRTDANELELRSTPSPWTSDRNTSGGARSVVVSLALPAYAVAGDIVELYRSKAVTSSPPSDELRRTVRYTLVAGDITAGFVAIADTMDETLLGEALYTNSTREGIENANGRPPSCAVIAEWRDSMWFGATRGPQTLVLDLRDATTMPMRSTTGTTSIGSNVITAVASTTNVKIGNKVVASTFTAAARVASFTANTITVNENSTAAAVGGTVELYDVVTINSVDYVAAAANSIANREFAVATGGTVATDAYITLRNLAYILSADSATLFALAIDGLGLAWGASPARLIVRRNDLATTSSFSAVVTGTNGLWDAPLGSFTSEIESKSNRIYYSKPQEPESVPPTNWLAVGEERADVLRIIGLPGALLIFKEDGLFRVTGTYPFFSCESLVPGLRFVRGEAIDINEDVVYAWTDRGVLEITENGIVANLSEGTIRDQLATYLDLHTATTSVRGTFLTCWRDRGLVLLGVGVAAASPWARYVFAFNLVTRAWSRWVFTTERAWRCAVYDIEQRRMIASMGSQWEVRDSVDGEPRGFDRAHTLAAWTYSATVPSLSVLPADIGTWVPAALDWITVNAEVRRVLSVTPVGVGPTSYTLVLNAAFTSTPIAPMVAYEGAPSTLEWMSHGGAPSSGNIVRELQLHLDTSRWSALYGSHGRILGGGASDYAAAATVTATPAFATVLSRPIRFGMPRSVARAAHLFPHVEINEPFRWRVMGVCLVGEGVSEKVRK